MLIPHTIQMKDDQHRGTGFFLDREHIRQNIDDIVIINPRFTPAPNLKNDRESHLYRSERGERGFGYNQEYDNKATFSACQSSILKGRRGRWWS